MREKLTLADFKGAIAGRTPKPIADRYRYYSVLAPLVERDGALHFLFETRSDTLRRQPGEAGFPGGRVEPGEAPLECALRETEEELRIPREGIEVIGELDYIQSYGESTLYCFLGSISKEAYDGMRICSDEVKDAFLAPVSFFMDHEPEVYRYRMAPLVGDDFPYERIQPKGPYKWGEGRMTVPIYNFGDRAIWGMTARMIWNLVKLLRGRPSEISGKSVQRLR